MSDFSEKHHKNADLFFSSENGGGVGVFFFKFFFWSVLDNQKTNISGVGPYKIPPPRTPAPGGGGWYHITHIAESYTHYPLSQSPLYDIIYATEERPISDYYCQQVNIVVIVFHCLGKKHSSGYRDHSDKGKACKHFSITVN